MTITCHTNGSPSVASRDRKQQKRTTTCHTNGSPSVASRDGKLTTTCHTNGSPSVTSRTRKRKYEGKQNITLKRQKQLEPKGIG